MDALILIGPNGVGKSTVGRALASTGAFQYLDLEAFFVERYASVDEYRADRTHAYRQFETEVRTAIAANGLPVVFEEVGLNDSALAMLTALRRDYDVVLVELLASLEECLQRADTRTGGDRFPKSGDSVRAVWEQFAKDRGRIGPVAHRIDTEVLELSAMITSILDAVRTRTRAGSGPGPAQRDE